MLERNQTIDLPGASDQLYLSFNVPSHATAPDAVTAPALSLLCEVLGKGFSARLYNDLVRDKRLIKGVSLTYEALVRGDTLLTISATVNTQATTSREAAEAIYTKVDELRHTPLSAEELDSAKLRMLTRRLFSLDNLAQQAERIGAAAAAGLAPSVIDLETDIIRRLDSAQVRQVAFDYLRRERLTITHLTPGAPA
ncbi:Peptidase M16 inactive domain protein [compost metagenome]